ncbi:hypothetical protein, partial [Bacteroides salyersiae]|uniref:hypothetical protein n=2 Tax=Bacteroides salyersiae TaxID=291644 RepID=UPI001961A2F5
RTEKLSPVTPMVLRNSGRVGSRRFFLKDPLATRNTGARGFSRFHIYISLILLFTISKLLFNLLKQKCF